ncbi:hypothetical protein GW17_00036415 [Ensete ventricosum]|nr:hypothetical protein GW17_00036415 [Ensete ventricosum]
MRPPLPLAAIKIEQHCSILLRSPTNPTKGYRPLPPVQLQLCGSGHDLSTLYWNSLTPTGIIPRAVEAASPTSASSTPKVGRRKWRPAWGPFFSSTGNNLLRSTGCYSTDFCYLFSSDGSPPLSNDNFLYLISTGRSPDIIANVNRRQPFTAINNTMVSMLVVQRQFHFSCSGGCRPWQGYRSFISTLVDVCNIAALDPIVKRARAAVNGDQTLASFSDLRIALTAGGTLTTIPRRTIGRVQNTRCAH